jgi:hypothetical protein
MNFLNNKKGNILLWSLIITALVIGSVIFISDFIISSMKQGKLSTNALKAYYLAESAIEKAVYTLRQVNKSSNFNLNENLGGGKVILQSQPIKQLTIDLKEGETYQIDIMYPANASVLDEPVNQLKFKGQTSTGYLEIKTLGWESGASYSTAQPLLAISLEEPTNINSGFWFSFGVNTTEYYNRIIRIKALHGDISNLDIYAYNGNNFTTFPMITSVKAQGFYQNSSQKINITMPRRPPLYGLFDYVIFSDDLLTK